MADCEGSKIIFIHQPPFVFGRFNHVTWNVAWGAWWNWKSMWR